MCSGNHTLTPSSLAKTISHLFYLLGALSLCYSRLPYLDLDFQARLSSLRWWCLWSYSRRCCSLRLAVYCTKRPSWPSSGIPPSPTTDEALGNMLDVVHGGEPALPARRLHMFLPPFTRPLQAPATARFTTSSACPAQVRNYYQPTNSEDPNSASGVQSKKSARQR